MSEIQVTEQRQQLAIAGAELSAVYCCWLCGQEPEMTDEDESATEPERLPHHDDQKHKHIGEQTDKEIIQNFLTGDFCVHGVSLSHTLQSCRD